MTDLTALRTAGNAMLRHICKFGRAPDEEWLHWFKRITKKAWKTADEAGIREWVQAHAAQKWSWAGHVARRPAATWLYKVTVWRDSNWGMAVGCLGCERPLRRSRRRWMKWEDSLRRFCAERGLGSWTDLSLEKTTWMKWQIGFADWFSGQKLEVDECLSHG